MALKADGRHYCKVAWIEQGRVTVRRVHCMIVQVADGRIFELSKDKLPDAFVLTTGEPYKGEHMAQVLLNPRKLLECPSFWELLRGWPSGRDMLHVLLGASLALIVCIVFSVYMAILPLL